MTARPLEILLVEDDPGDVVMTREAFEDRGVTGRLHVVRDGVEALDFLRRGPGYDTVPRPDLVLLDLNLPRMAGHEVLAEIRSDAGLTDIPVVVLTTSAARDDVLASYRLHANAHVTKPTGYDDFTEVVSRIDEFFGGTALLP